MASHSLPTRAGGSSRFPKTDAARLVGGGPLSHLSAFRPRGGHEARMQSSRRPPVLHVEAFDSSSCFSADSFALVGGDGGAGRGARARGSLELRPELGLDLRGPFHVRCFGSSVGSSWGSGSSLGPSPELDLEPRLERLASGSGVVLARAGIELGSRADLSSQTMPGPSVPLVNDKAHGFSLPPPAVPFPLAFDRATATTTRTANLRTANLRSSRDMSSVTTQLLVPRPRGRRRVHRLLLRPRLGRWPSSRGVLSAPQLPGSADAPVGGRGRHF